MRAALDAPPARWAWAAGGWVNGTTVGAHTVPRGGTRVVSPGRHRRSGGSYLRSHSGRKGANWGLTESGRSGRVRNDGTVASRMSPCC
jgi:hypothetical protein